MSNLFTSTEWLGNLVVTQETSKFNEVSVKSELSFCHNKLYLRDKSVDPIHHHLTELHKEVKVTPIVVKHFFSRLDQNQRRYLFVSKDFLWHAIFSCKRQDVAEIDYVNVSVSKASRYAVTAGEQSCNTRRPSEVN